MTDDRDPLIQQLFDAARKVEVSDNFAALVMARIDSQRRKVIVGWTLLGLVLVPCAWLLGSMMQDVAQLMAQVLPSEVVDVTVDFQWVKSMIAPVNTVGAVIAFGLLLLRAAYRRIFA